MIGETKLLPTMTINNYLFFPSIEIPAEFKARCILAKLSAYPRNYP